MNKYFKIIISLFSVIFFYSQSLTGASVGRADVYKVKMERSELCEDENCENYTPMCTSTKEADIASVNAGAEVGSWCSLTGLPIGKTFTHIRVKLHRGFTIQGNVVDRHNDGTDCYTGSTVASTSTQTAYGSEAADGSKTAVDHVEQEIWLYDARSDVGGNYIKSSSGNVDSYWGFYTHATRPTGATSWCVGTIAGTHNEADGVCADTNLQSPTWDDNASATTTQIIYPLQTPYTVGPVAPKLTLTFDTSQGLGAEAFGANCEMSVGQVKFTATLSE